jgi:hypothetical protein
VSVPGAQPKRAVSWIFDVTIMVAGGLVGVVALGDLLFGGHLDMQWTVALLIGAPIAALMSRFPLVLNRSSSGIEVGFDSAVLVFLVCFHGGASGPPAKPSPRSTGPSGPTSACSTSGSGSCPASWPSP